MMAQAPHRKRDKQFENAISPCEGSIRILIQGILELQMPKTNRHKPPGPITISGATASVQHGKTVCHHTIMFFFNMAELFSLKYRPNQTNSNTFMARTWI
jgi:hypothetical protein